MRVRSMQTMEKIREFIEEYYDANDTAPSQRAIAEYIGISVSNVNGYLNEMSERGMLSRSSASSRKYISAKKSDARILVPLIGEIACGGPIYAKENVERYVSFSNSMLGEGKFFLLKAVGNSMINVGVDDGDLVLVRQQNYANEGQIVVALIDDSTTLKRYYTDDKLKKIRLHPENDEMEDMYFDSIEIQGVAIKVIKNLE